MDEQPLIEWDKPNWGEEGQNIHVARMVDETEATKDHCKKHCQCTPCRERREDKS